MSNDFIGFILYGHRDQERMPNIRSTGCQEGGQMPITKDPNKR